MLAIPPSEIVCAGTAGLSQEGIFSTKTWRAPKRGPGALGPWRGLGAEPRPPEAALTLKGGARSDQRGALFPAPHPNRPQALSSAAHPPEQHDSAQFGNSQVSKLAERCGLAFRNVAALDISVTSLLLGEWHLTDKSRAVRLYASGCQRLISAAGAPAARQTGWAR